MSVDPIAFLRTAELLKEQVDEAHSRTSIGRSYYAAFLHFRERLRQIGLEKIKHPSREAHAFVIQCLQFSEVTEGVKASCHLHDLQQIREDADYHLEKDFSQNDAEDAFAKAQKVISDYENQMTAEKKKTLLEKASKYAKLKDWL